MPKISIIKSNFLENYYKNKYALCIIIIFGFVMLLHYIYSIKNQTRLIENYTQSELKKIANKMDEVDTTPEKKDGSVCIINYGLVWCCKKAFWFKMSSRMYQPR